MVQERGNIVDSTRILLILLTTISCACANSTTPCHVTTMDQAGTHVTCSSTRLFGKILTFLEHLDKPPVSLVLAPNPYLLLTRVGFSKPVFVNLERLDFSHNEFTDFVPEVVSVLPKLRVLNLSDNNLTEMDDTFFTGLNLTILHLGNNEISEIAEDSFRSLEHLVELYLPGNNLTLLPDGLFQGLTRLRKVDLKGNGLAHLHENLFQGLHNLEELNLSDNKLADFGITTFEQVANLRQLSLDGNQLHNIDVRLFQENVKLVTLGLSRNRLSNLSNVALNVTSLQQLNLAKNNIERLPEDFFLLTPKLVSIQLGENKLNVLNTTVFQTLRYLGHIDLAGNGVGVVMVSGFKKQGEKEEDSQPIAFNLSPQ